jgi:hypothetical protein
VARRQLLESDCADDGNDLMPFIGNIAPQLPEPMNTYTVDPVTHTYTYSKGAKISNGASAVDLTLTVLKPLGHPAHRPLPAVVYINNGSFSISTSDPNDASFGPDGFEMARWFVQCGVLVALVETRVHPDTPTEPDGTAQGAINALGRSINALRWDVYRALKFIQSNPDRANWTCQPELVFLAGGSAGGGLAAKAVIEHYPADMDLAGMVLISTAFGLDNGLLGMNATDEIRTDLGYTEADLDGTPPICLFNKDDDNVLSTGGNDWEGDMIAAVQGFAAPNIAHVDSTAAGHYGLDQWDEPGGLTAATTIEEAIQEFLNGVATGIYTEEPGPPDPPGTADIWVPDDFTTIQGAINFAAPGDVIGVRGPASAPTGDGTYASTGVNLNKAVTLRTWDNAVIQAQTAGSGTGIEILSDNASVIGNFIIREFGEGIAVDAGDTVGFDLVDIQGLGHEADDRLVITSDTASAAGTQYGMWITGEAWDVRYVEIDRVRRSYGGDIDYARVFGRDHYFLRCYFHGVDLPDDLAPLSGTDYGHTDCFQFYNQNTDNQRILIDCTWEECMFTEMVQGFFIANEFVAPNCISGLIMRNCVIWGVSFTPVSNLIGMLSHGIFLGKEDAITNVLIENCTLRLCANVWTLDGIPGSTITIRNCIYDGVSGEGTVYSFQSGTPKSVLDVDTGNLLWDYSWFGAEGGFGADETGEDPMMAATLLGGETDNPWGALAGWRPGNVAAQSYGAQIAA